MKKAYSIDISSDRSEVYRRGSSAEVRNRPSLAELERAEITSSIEERLLSTPEIRRFSSTTAMTASNVVTPVKQLSLSSSFDNEAAAAATIFSVSNGDEVSKQLHFAVWPMTDFGTFKDLIKKRPEEIHGRYGPCQETLLHRACRYGNKRVFDFLLAQGAVLTARNKCGQTPLHLACKFGREEMLMELITRGVPLSDTDDKGDQAIHFAAKSGSCTAIKLLVSKGVFKCVTGYRGNNMVHYAAQYGQYDLLLHLLEAGCNPSTMNELTETPLHLAAAHFSKKHKGGVQILELLLKFGAKLSARTHWGDTPAHYAGLRGTSEVLEFLINKGCKVHKKSARIFLDFFEKHKISPEDQEEFQMSLLQKVARSGCQVKAHIVLEKIMDARNKLAKNMYYGNRGIEIEQDEMNDQEMSFLNMSCDLTNVSDTGDGQSAFYMFLKYSPDSLVKLFDLCIVKPCQEQIQGQVYFDFFLFRPQTDEKIASEMDLINTLITSGKERFLIHPIFEIFLKLKWYKTWTLYLVYIILDFIFLLSLAGYTLVHFGKLYTGFENYDHKTVNFWWYFLATTHAYMSLLTFGKFMQVCQYLNDFIGQNKKIMKKVTMAEKFLNVGAMVIKDLMMPTLLGCVLYGNFSEEVLRYFLAFTVILTSYHFMTVISRLPRIGLYVHMLTKVMMTVLNFFASYMWHFLGYAIAFHILLPNSTPFATFFDSMVKVLAMLMGEYEYTINFVSNDNSSFIAKILFVIFVIDMSVVLMNLVLGLAISDIEQLQKNSAVRRMIQESCTVMFMENLYMILSRIPGLAQFFCSRITNDRTCNFQDVVFLDVVDLDKSPQNCLVLERSFPLDSKRSWPCPHSIVSNITKIISNAIIRRRLNEPSESTGRELAKTQKTQQDIMSKIDQLQEMIRDLQANDKGVNTLDKTD